jgi:hypothetical protein
MALRFSIFPQHAAIADSFMIYGTGQSQPAVIDAILFLGQLSLHENGLGDAPDAPERFFIYLQIFSVISTNARSHQARFLANSHVARCLRAHPSEAVRLAYVRDTLQHCPFESVKAAVIGMLKDEIVHATTPAVAEIDDSPSSPQIPRILNSIFASEICLQEVFDDLFPDLEKVFANKNTNSDIWETFKQIHCCVSATVNLYLLILLNGDIRRRLGFPEQDFVNKIEERFLKPIRSRLGILKEMEKKESGIESIGDVLEVTIVRVDEVVHHLQEEGEK